MPKKREEPILSTLGYSGLARWGRFLSDEWLSDLQGAKGRKAYREMADNDPTVGALLFAIRQIIRGCRWSVIPASQEEEDLRAAEFLEQCMWDMEMPWSDVIAESLSFLVYGFAVLEILYKYRRGDQESPLEHSKYNDNRVGWRGFALRPAETIEDWDWDEKTGVIRGLWQRKPDGSRIKIPREKFVHIRTEAHRGLPEGRSILRNAYIPWYFKKHIQTLEGIGIERDLTGLPILYVPVEVFEKRKAEFEAIVRNLRRDQEEGLVFPWDPIEGKTYYKLELLSPSGNRQFNINEVLARYDRSIAQTVLADFILLGMESKGSYALAREKRTAFEIGLLAWLDTIADAFNSQAVPRLFAFNTFEISDLPEITYTLPRVPSSEEVAQVLDTMVRAGFDLSLDAGLEEWLRQLIGAPARPAGLEAHPDKSEGEAGEL